jgi:hypothetical protein
MEPVDAAAMVTQLLQSSGTLLIEASEFLYGARHVHGEEYKFVDKVKSLHTTLETLSATLAKSQKRAISYHGTYQEELQILNAMKEVLDDVCKLVSDLRTLVGTEEDSLLAEVETQLRLHVRSPALQGIEFGITTNIGNLQLLVACFHL